MGSQVQGSEGPRGQIDVRGHHLPNGGRVLEAIGRERIELVITTGPCCATHSLRRHHARGRVSVMSITSILYRTSAGSPTRSWSDVGVLLVPEQFAKIQRQAGDGPIGQEFFKACATWVWALLKHQHDPQLPNAAGMCVCVCVCRFSLTAREVSSTWNPLISPISRVLGRPFYNHRHLFFGARPCSKEDNVEERREI